VAVDYPAGVPADLASLPETVRLRVLS
jgi:hypothetical protein